MTYVMIAYHSNTAKHMKASTKDTWARLGRREEFAMRQ